MPDSNTRNKKHKSTRKNRTGNLRFEASVKSDQVHLHASAPAKWFRLLLKIIVILLIALLILKMPELWQAIQTAISSLPK